MEVYNALQERGESFDIVMICLDDDDEDEESFNKAFANMPWFALPFKVARSWTGIFITPPCVGWSL